MDELIKSSITNKIEFVANIDGNEDLYTELEQYLK